MVLVVLGILFLNYVVLSTPKARAYRDLDPSVAACREGFDKGWTVLADAGRDRLGGSIQAKDDGWTDPTDDEFAVIARDASWKDKFRCSLQHHVVPAHVPGNPSLSYTLGFLEFQEDGEPYALVSQDPGVGDVRITGPMLQRSMEDEMHKRNVSASSVKPVITQLDALEKHLSTGSNFVIVFIHGWRHDARIGDGNVADLRLYAAHAARFIAQRCPVEPRFCDMKVTAIYVGWRGARVDEAGLKTAFGDVVGGALGNLSAGVTLFDRKPVAETIAPAAVSAIQSLEGVLAAPPGSSGPARNMMTVVGHSLGGDMLATGLKDDLIKAVRRHKAGDMLPPVLGDLVVLVNPAAEATKWTAIQREVWSRTAQHTDANTTAADVIADNGFFPDRQKPVVRLDHCGAGVSGGRPATRRLCLGRTYDRR